MKLGALVLSLNDVAPLQDAEPWDNVGLLTGDPDQEVTKVLLTIDLTMAVLKEVQDSCCELVIAYHPPIFEGLKRIDARSPVGIALRHGIAIYSPHTALDAAIGGTNDHLADVAGLNTRTAIRRVAGAVRGEAAASGDNLKGMGRIGTVAATSRLALIERVKSRLGIDQVLVAGPTDGPLQKVAVAAGAAGDLLKLAIKQGADAVITGEVRHHDALVAAAAGVMLICTRHSCSERRALEPLRDRLAQRHPQVVFVVSDSDADPFKFA